MFSVCLNLTKRRCCGQRNGNEAMVKLLLAMEGVSPDSQDTGLPYRGQHRMERRR